MNVGEAAALNATECGVTQLQADVIRSVFRNDSCGYNITVASVLGRD